MKTVINIYYKGQITTRTIDVDREKLIYSVAEEVIDFMGKEAAAQHHSEMVHYQLEDLDGSVIDSGKPQFQNDLGIPDADGILTISLDITPKVFGIIRTAINRLLETDNEDNRKKAKQCIKKATDNGTIVPHLPALREYLQKNAKDDQGKHKSVVNEVRSWLNEATPVVELSAADKISLIKELFKVEPNIDSIKKTLHGVTSLSLEESGINDLAVQALAKALKNNTTLTSLDLRSNKIKDSGTKELAEALNSNTTLISLNLYNNNIQHSGAIDLAKALKINKTLTSLSLGKNQIGIPGVTALAETLESNTTLTSLNLEHNKIEETKELAEALKINKTLTSLNLSCCSLGHQDTTDLAEALKINATLTFLNLESNQIKPSGAQALAEALNSNITLTTLDLGYNQIGCSGAQALAATLNSNITLTSLSLKASEIGGSGATALIKVLKSNASLISLNLHAIEIEDRDVTVLAEILKSNVTSLTSLDLSGVEIGDSGVEHLMDALKSNYSLLFFTSAYPELRMKTGVYLQRNKNRLEQATQYLMKSFVEEVTKDTPLITPLSEIIGGYLAPKDIISSAELMSQVGLHSGSHQTETEMESLKGISLTTKF